ncbi:hypothetical protein HPB50_016209 [Hyalomma asiaticum]|uniref:Uncharacterized protein n=1 Tax=Hyalomma asiaticum TaxID=266040 RepID=A0ACB7SMC4_HYAAI|nr:hypothetical protein HPB50_016209 [Hyalomma asiaticum]
MLILTWPMLARGASMPSEWRKPAGCFAAFWGWPGACDALYTRQPRAGRFIWVRGLAAVYPSPTAGALTRMTTIAVPFRPLASPLLPRDSSRAGSITVLYSRAALDALHRTGDYRVTARVTPAAIRVSGTEALSGEAQQNHSGPSKGRRPRKQPGEIESRNSPNGEQEKRRNRTRGRQPKQGTRVPECNTAGPRRCPCGEGPRHANQSAAQSFCAAKRALGRTLTSTGRCTLSSTLVQETPAGNSRAMHGFGDAY